ncbi:arginine repressor [Streptococcus loxodontisalivarius]|uniref:Arginine repressor n=1 Tax=Streptococcus loxodontisalivarius TaxID=1349415 RepID=A0ABS2PPH9_9STRE|nr:arginine repressor [Streptococcus loxodontisalivarius]MBM7641938.1 transcriptional regulator of arginine metabolism [Streptococcus loxodontisalivarius]
MNKKERHVKIKEMIKTGRIGTQEEIKDRLEEIGVYVTQATLSRDLREIGLMKLRAEDGKLYYSLTESDSTHFSANVSEYIIKVSRAEFMLVLTTRLGEADVLANVIDGEKRQEILGTVAGADTLLVICQSAAIAKELEKEIQSEI